MITQIYIPLSISYQNTISDNGLNIEIDRLDNENQCSVKFVDDSGKQIVYFEIEFDELKRAVEKLEFKT